MRHNAEYTFSDVDIAAAAANLVVVVAATHIGRVIKSSILAVGFFFQRRDKN